MADIFSTRSFQQFSNLVNDFVVDAFILIPIILFSRSTKASVLRDVSMTI
ncbi:hypothetical protein KAR48_18720 [bacterium]|nr:hypothetical protein [bacterium]